jgi:hypothetical protein
MSPLHGGASIRVNDSLQEGSSRFYAEITPNPNPENLSNKGKAKATSKPAKRE